MKQSKKLAILAALTAGMSFSGHADAYDSGWMNYNGQRFIDFAFFNEGEYKSQYTLSEDLRDGILSATTYWSDMLGPRSGFSSPWPVLVVTEKNYQNASAGTDSVLDGKSVGDNYIAQMLQGRRTLDSLDFGLFVDAESEEDVTEELMGTHAYSEVKIGQHFGANRSGAIEGWWVDAGTILPNNEQAADFIGCFRHELGHALGIAAVKKSCDWDGKDIPDDEDEIHYGTHDLILSKFADDVTNPNAWNNHLVDQNGNPAKAGMLIVTTEGFNILKEKNPAIQETDCFIVDAGNYAYFVGDHVTEVLAGATFNGVSGVPVNAFEKNSDGSYKKVFEGSHLQTPGMMSHRSYTNYTAFMEVELAVMQDLGYDIDRKAYFGRSIYGSGQTVNNTQGYSARNAEGTAYTSDYSQVPLGIGLHVFGSDNDVTQSANILTEGTGAAGIRVDGVGNTIHVPVNAEIHADGANGKGILFAYGRNQNLDVAGTVTAKGTGGNAVEFNFGSSSNGALDEYRGTYIRYKRDVSEITGEITEAKNPALNDMDVNTYNATADELNGEMVTDFNLSGQIAGSENAVYIGRNAFVKNINVQKGADITGAITSDWKHFSEEQGIYATAKTVSYQDDEDEDGTTETKTGTIEPLQLQYQGKAYTYTDYIPDLVTNLNFDLQDGAMLYQGNINGSDNMKMNVTSGALAYTGTADVVSVNVAQGAALLGGTYTVNDMTASMAEGFSDSSTGQVINHGMIGAVSPDTNMTINGTLVSDGVLSGYGGGEAGQIIVNGTANIDGSKAAATNLMPGESMTVLQAGAITGDVANPEGEPYAATGILSTTGAVEGNTLKVTAYAANNLGEMTEDEFEGYDAVTAMQVALMGDARREELRKLYSLTPSDARSVLDASASADTPQMMSLVQQSSLASRVISDRLNTAFATEPVEVNVPVNHWADSDKKDGIKVNMDLPVARDNNAWVKFTKNWGDLKGGANYHGSAVSGGYDRRLSDHWRGGVFLSYQSTSVGAQSSGGNIYDTRFGVYAGYHKDAADAYIYADYGWVRNKQYRSLRLLGLGTEAKYNSHLAEIGGEYKYDLHAKDGKVWHVSPYVGLQLSWLKQNAYSETGAGIFNQHVAGKSNTYFAGQLGVELKRYLHRGNYGMRIGVKHAFAGADPELSFHYEGYDGKSYGLQNSQDRTHFLLSLSGETEFAKGWFLNGEAQWQKGVHDKDISAAAQFKRVW